MSFSIGDRVTCARFGNRIGRIVRLKKLRGLALVAWSRNVTGWIDTEELQAAQAGAVLAPQNSRSWFNPPPLTLASREREARIQAIRDRELVGADERR